MTSHVVRAGILALVCFASAGAAQARTNFDGIWSVLIVTEKGTCDRAYRYGVEIRNGTVRYQGSGPIELAGRVSKNGVVRVTVRSGNQFASGTGRMARNAGRGSWSGRASSGSCSGYWTAEPR